MDFQIQITDPALKDLEEILAYSCEQYPFDVESFANALLDHIKILASFPYIGSQVGKNVRRLVHTPLLIFYVVYPEKRCVEVLHFWHGSRDSSAFRLMETALTG